MITNSPQTDATPLSAGDLVRVGRQAQTYKVLQIRPDGRGAALLETVDAEPYRTEFENAAHLVPVIIEPVATE